MIVYFEFLELDLPEFVYETTRLVVKSFLLNFVSYQDYQIMKNNFFFFRE
jgi:hypothetical protein